MESAYDLAGRKIKTIDPNGEITQFGYDNLGRHIKTTDPLGFETEQAFDGNGNLISLTDANATAALQPINNDGATLSRQYDELNRVILERNALNGDTLFDYDLLGNRTSVTDAEGRSTIFTFDDLGRLVTMTDPLIETPTDKVTTLTYDQAGNVLTRTNRKDEVARFTYDDLNRVVKAEYLVSGNVTYQEDFAYDHFGDRIMVKNDDVTYTFAYDTKHRVTTKMDNRPPSVITNSLQYTYDQVGNVSTKTDYQGAITDYRYDSANRLVSMRNPDYVEVSYQYDPAGRLLTRILSNGTTTSYGYDDNNRLVSLKTDHASGSVVGEETYIRDRVGNIQTVTTSEGTTMFTYDPLYRLADAVYPGAGNTYNYTYDKVGNRLTQIIGTTTQAYIYNEGNRLLEIRDGSVTGPLVNQFNFDDEGNMSERRDGIGTLLQSYTTDAKGRITQMITGGDLFTYAYDPMDYRISKAGPGVTADYLLEGEHVEKVTGSHQPAQFFRGVVVDEIVNGYQYDPQGVWTNYTYAHDSLRSVVGLSGHEGATIQTTQYAPFGSERDGAGASCSVLRYTGRERDAETGLYYYRARYYDPSIGRFLTEDPLGFGAGDVNFYAYVGNNPINANDPSGKVNAPGAAIGFFSGLVGGAVTGFAKNESVVEGVIGGGVGGVVGAVTGFFSNNPALSNRFGSIAANFILGLSGNVAGQFAGNAITDVRNNQPINVFDNFSLSSAVTSTLSAPLSVSGIFGPVVAATGSRALGVIAGGTAQGVLSSGLDLAGGFVGDTLSNLPVVPLGLAGPLSNARFNFDLPRLDQGPSLSNAAGGFLLYPNKPNLNMLQAVYSK